MKSANQIAVDLGRRGLTDMAAEVCTEYGVTLQEVCDRRRTANIAAARHELWWRILSHPKRHYSISDVARMFGRDAATVNAATRERRGKKLGTEMIAAPTGPSDTDALHSLLASDGLDDEERHVFQDMLDKIERGGLTRKQRAWVDSVRSRLELDAGDVENLHSRGLVTTGRPVELAPVLRVPLPKKPPGK